MLAACKQPQIPEYQAFENFRLSKIGMNETVVSADLKYFNPNEYELQFKRADLDISLNDKYVGKTVLDTLIRIPGRDTFYVPVQMKVNLKQLFSNAFSMLLTNEMEVKVNGVIRIGRSGFFMNMPVNYSGKQGIDW
ncbi:hypothetical protein BC349_02945 [Flavihumibacter stibioxidans]|uniref:Late embryogenesis abundant protein LEA-2 subgroup domain-containing protein n=1 Tax=Flavihumibacter stibioxidans TaxID=1834163 RepID=A0ABR7M5V3_9BACT|nr:hypothetical protein [Flavihumibacter stibioxidans]